MPEALGAESALGLLLPTPATRTGSRWSSACDREGTATVRPALPHPCMGHPCSGPTRKHSPCSLWQTQVPCLPSALPPRSEVQGVSRNLLPYKFLCPLGKCGLPFPFQEHNYTSDLKASWEPPLGQWSDTQGTGPKNYPFIFAKEIVQETLI